MVNAGDLVKRGDVYWVNLDPTIGSEIQKTRPALVISPNDMNAALPRVIVAPITSKGQALGCRPEVNFNGKSGRILLDQIRCVDKVRLLGKLGEIDEALWRGVLLQMLG
jgi:mRNA interferase MazF